MQARTRIPLNQGWVTEQRRMKALASAVAELDLDLRTVNGLEEVGVLYVRELVELSRAELNKIPNFGGKSVERIIRVLGEHGLRIREVTTSKSPSE
jgi:DNA-directed RNA polymerase alpha subunit